MLKRIQNARSTWSPLWLPLPSSKSNKSSVSLKTARPDSSKAHIVWKVHDLCFLNLMTFTHKPHKFSNSSWDFLFKLMSFTWKLMSFQRTHDLTHEFSTTSWVFSTPWGLTHVEIMSFICCRSWTFHFVICWNSWVFVTDWVFVLIPYYFLL